MNAQILINCGDNWFEFTKSKTGQLDYAGKIKMENSPLNQLGDYTQIASSAFFSPSGYLYMRNAQNYTPRVYVAKNVDVSDADTFCYLVHVGALLAAIEEKDCTLAGELYLYRRFVFDKFPQLSQYIMEPLSVEILFSMVYGRSENLKPDSIPLIFNSARARLEYDSSREKLDQAMMRYFKKHKVTLTLPLVGTSFYPWLDGVDTTVFDCPWKNINYIELLSESEKIRQLRHNFFAGLEIVLQAEPYNSHDKNSILCSIDDIGDKLYGYPALEKAGHLRATAAAIIREAKPEQLVFNAKIARLSGDEVFVNFEV